MNHATTPTLRFAPSPTGFLHIGGARTALFNWLYARGRGGRFLLRIEDTDRARATDEAERAIFEGLRWLGIDWDGEAVSQFSRRNRHAEVVGSLLAGGHAYRCYASRAEIEKAREKARMKGGEILFRSPWRDAPRTEWPKDTPYAVRLRVPRPGEVAIDDLVQGAVRWNAADLDDLILLRADGTPTYNLAVVVDDHDMAITHVVRGDDHLTNTARQALIYRALGWQRPVFSHIPLIHGADGAKLSKRHGAVSVMAYRDMGFLPAAMRNCLARLGWAHGDEEFFTDRQALQWFDLRDVGRAPARFDIRKLTHLNFLHMRAMQTDDLMRAFRDYVAAHNHPVPSGARQSLLAQFLPNLRNRAKNLAELFDLSYFILCENLPVRDEKAQKLMDEEAIARLAQLTNMLRCVTNWSATALEQAARDLAHAEGVRLAAMAQPARVALTGRAVSAGIFEIMALLGAKESMRRLEAAVGAGGSAAADKEAPG